MPCLIPPGTPYQFTVDADSCHRATRVDGGVPVFSDHVKVTKGLAAKNEVGGSAPSAAGVPPLAAPVAGEEAEGDPEGSGLEEWADALDQKHFLTHLPKSRNCQVCLQAKLQVRPHRRLAHHAEGIQIAQAVEAPTAFPQKIAIDHLFAPDEETGTNGETVSLVCTDLYSGAVYAISRSGSLVHKR